MNTEIYRKINMLPSSVCIEACSLCNLNCTDCFMRKKPYPKDFTPVVNKGYLKAEAFKNFIKKNPYIKNVELSLSGEIFLNPELEEIIKFAAAKKINLTAFNGVNFNSVSDEILETLVKYGFKGLSFSIDGASEETYKIYRRGGSYNKVIENIKKLNDYKEKYKSKFPVFKWQYIVFKHNIHEVKKAAEAAEKLNFACIYFKEPWNKEITKDTCLGIGNAVLFKPYFDKEIRTIIEQNSFNLCLQPWLSPQINWDGRLLGCCCSVYHDLGVNVFKTDLKTALKSEKMQNMRTLLKGKKAQLEGTDCKKCSRYKLMQETGCYLKQIDVLYMLWKK